MTISWPELRKRIGIAAKQKDEFAGYPVPAEAAPLVLDPKHPLYKRFNGLQIGKELKASEDDGKVTVVNSWWSRKRNATIYICREDGQLWWVGIPHGSGHKAKAIIDCATIAMTMDVEAERRAVATLRSLVKPHMADAYEITGSFFETSKRSGHCYIFRRMATTVVMAPRHDADDMVVLGSLCLHPMGYYDALPMGIMVPTDDVIAHLVMMRADEHMFWRKANFHSPGTPGAML